MGRHAEGWKLEWRGKPGAEYGYVRFTHKGKQHLISTGTRDPERASVEAAAIYVRTVSGQAARTGRRRSLVARPLTELFAEWLASLEGTLDPETSTTYRVTYAGKHWPAHYRTLEDMCSDAEREKYRTNRLRAATADTVQKEIWAQDKFLRWCKKVAGVISHVPDRVEWDGRELGTRTGKQRQHARELRPDQVVRVIVALPEWHETGKRALERKPYPIRDRFIVGYETALRPATLDGLEWRDWLGNELRIRPEVDKSRFGRVVPLSEAARLALARVHDGAGARGLSVDPRAPIFGRHEFAKVLNKAGKAAGLDGCAPYDIRHARATHMADAGAALTGIGFVVGHKQATTTNRYLHAGKDAARQALSRSILGDSANGLVETGWPTGLGPATTGATRQRDDNSSADLDGVGEVGDAAEVRRNPTDTQYFRGSDLEKPDEWPPLVASVLRAIHCGQAELLRLSALQEAIRP